MTTPSAPDDLLWQSDVPRYGVVRTVIVDGAFAARFDDLNGDGREVELGIFARRHGTWLRVGHRDDVGGLGIGETPLFGWAGAIGWAVGRARPGERLELHWAGERAVVGVNDQGWWLGVVSGEPPEDEGSRPWTGPSTRTFT